MRNNIDLSNRIFGRLTVLRLERLGHNGSSWLCHCICGSEVIVKASHLLNGHKKSCGCLHINNLTGRSFGRLKVVGDRTGRPSRWLCQCSCGSETRVRSGSLLAGRTKSCGCLQRELRGPDLKGRAFGRLEVIENTGERRHGNIVWLCQCSCGAKTQVRSRGLLSGKTRSCGCLQRETISLRTRKRPYEALYNHFRLVNKNKHPVEISYEDFLEFTSTENCHYCGGPVAWSKYDLNGNGNRYNLDRKNKLRGYVKGNLVVCCKRCNTAKSNTFSYEEWMIVGKALQEYRNQYRGEKTP